VSALAKAAVAPLKLFAKIHFNVRNSAIPAIGLPPSRV